MPFQKRTSQRNKDDPKRERKYLRSSCFFYVSLGHKKTIVVLVVFIDVIGDTYVIRDASPYRFLFISDIIRLKYVIEIQ